jgi:serine/threonine protein phosphatase PrpC
MQTRFAGMTDTGLLREHNEDSLLLMPEYGIVAVADGMGGHRSGDVASQLAISTLSDFFQVVVGRDGTWPFPADPELSDEENYVITSLRLANRRIFDRSLRTMADFGMGTTIVAAMFTRGADKVTVGHVGDSRCYRLRGPELTQLTMDHTLGNAGIQGPSAQVLSRAVGTEPDVEVDVVVEAPFPGDIYLLCSDGLSRSTNDDAIRDTLRTASDLDQACAALIDKAKAGGGRDNITAILVRVDAAKLGLNLG